MQHFIKNVLEHWNGYIQVNKVRLVPIQRITPKGLHLMDLIEIKMDLSGRDAITFLANFLFFITLSDKIHIDFRKTPNRVSEIKVKKRKRIKIER